MSEEPIPAAVQLADVDSRNDSVNRMKPYANPYVAGFGLGLVLLAAFLIMGRGLGASGAFTSLVAWGVETVSPQHAQANDFYAGYLGDGSTHPLMAWLVFEVIGMFAGGFLSAALAGRIRKAVERGPSISSGGRLFLAFAGGGLMGIGSKLARGCTSGQALTGGALLGVGSWAFMLAVFAGGYGAAWFMRRQWR